METRKSAVLEVQIDPIESANAVGLRYVTDALPGIRRVKAAKGFRYLDAEGRLVAEEQLRRIRSLVIPPAWTRVWICAREDGHLQAVGYDVKGRKQYRYHPRWRQSRDETKYNRMIQFGRVLPKIRAQVEADMRRPGLPKEKVLATVVRLLEVSLIRVGNEEYARQNKSFGLTTMRDQHVHVSGSKVQFDFRGKSGKQHTVQVDDPRLARTVKRCQDLPGQELFQYLDDQGKRQTIGSADVNSYLKQISNQDFTAKDFRTWAGTVLAARALRELDHVDSQSKAKKNVIRAVEAVAQMLGNTPSICRKCYVHPAVLQAYLDGILITTLRRRAAEKLGSAGQALRPDETAVLRFLQRNLLSKNGARAGVRAGTRTNGERSPARIKATRIGRALNARLMGVPARARSKVTRFRGRRAL